VHPSSDHPVTHVPARVSLGDGLGDVAAHGLLASHRAHGGSVSLPRHEHGAPYLCVVLAGGYSQATTREIDCRRGSLVAHPGGHVHANRFGAQSTRCLNLFFDAEWLEDAALAALFSDYRQVSLDPRDAALGRLEREMETRDPASALGVVGTVLEIAARTVRGGDLDTAPAWLGRVCEAIAANLARPPELSALAAEAGVHPAHLCRAFRAAMGETIGAFSRRRRLEVADAMIRGDQQIAEIAAATGFYDQAHFARCFRRQYGVTPGRRRAQLAS
jgi:AraC family transcriptional regulator